MKEELSDVDGSLMNKWSEVYSKKKRKNDEEICMN